MIVAATTRLTEKPVNLIVTGLSGLSVSQVLVH